VTPAFSLLTTSQSITYGTASVTLSGKLSAPTGVYPPLGETVAVTINGSTQDTTISDGAGDFTVVFTTGTIPASGTPYAISYAYTGDSNFNAAPTDTSTALTVNKETPVLTIKSATTIEYSQPLSVSTITGTATNANTGNPVAGTFSFTAPGTMPVTTASQSVTFTPLDLNNYTTASGSVIVAITDPVIFVQPVSVTNVLGSNAVFSVTAAGTAPLNYQWFQNGAALPGATASNLVNNAIKDSDAGSYVVVITNSVGSVTSSIVTLTITHPPVFVTEPVSQVVNQGVTVNFSVSANGTTPFTYQWLKNGSPLIDGGNVSGSTSKKLFLSSVTGNDTANYSVIVTNADGVNTSTNASLTVIVSPVITSQPLSVTNIAGAAAVFSVTNIGTSPVYRWYMNGTNLLSDGGKISGSSTPVLTITNILGADEGTYGVVISNSSAVAISSNAMLVVIDPNITSEPVSATNNVGTPVTFTVAAYGTSPLHYQWLKNGSAIPAATSPSYSIAIVTNSDAANYTVIVTNVFGVVTSAPPAVLTVIAPPLINQEPANQTNNAGTTASFTVVATGTSLSYQWLSNGVPLSDVGNVSGSATATLTLANVQDADEAAYSVVLRNVLNIVTSAPPATLTVIDAPIITGEPASRTNNAGTTATFTVAWTGTSPNYHWYKNGGLLTDTGNVSGSTTATLTLADVQDADAASYTVALSNAAGSVTGAPPATLTVIDPPVITSQPSSRTNSAGTTATFTVAATGTSPNYHWYKNGGLLTDTGNVSGSTTSTLTLTDVQDGDVAGYTVTLNNAAGSVTSAPPATLTVIDPPIITQQPVSITNNAGTTATFAVLTTGTSPTYQWFKNDTNALANGGNVYGAESATLTLSNVFGIDGAKYSVVVSNSAATLVSTDATLTVIDPVITGQPVGVTNIDGSAVAFSVTVVGSSPLSYQWYQDGSILDGETESTLTLDDVADSDAGNYTVVVTNIYGNVTSTPAILVTVPPLIVAQPISVVALQGDSVSFSVSVDGASPFSYQWQQNGTNVSGGTSRILSFPSVSVTNAGNYRVYVTNPNGIQLSDTASLSVYTTAVPVLTITYTNPVATITLTGVPTFTYSMLTSTNLLNWAPLETSTSPFSFTVTNINYSFITNRSGSYYSRFYRGLYQHE